MADKPPTEAAPALGGRPLALAPKAYQRTKAAVEWVESTLRVGKAGQGSRRSPWTIPARLAKANGTITARSGTTIGTGSAYVVTLSGSTLTTGSDTVTVKNLTNKTIATNSYMLIIWAIGYWWAAVVDDCTHLT